MREQVSELHDSINQLNSVIYNESTEYVEVIDELTILTGNGLIVWDKVDDVYNIAALDQNNMNYTYTIGCTVNPGEQIKIKCVSYYNNYTGAGIIFSDSTESIPLWNDSISIIPTSNYDCFAGNTSSAWKNCEYEITVPERAKTVWVRGSNSDTTKIFKNKVIYNSKIPSKTSDLINDSNFIMDKKLPVICFDFDELRNNNIDSRFTILKSYGFTGNVVDSNNIEVTQKLVKMGFDISPYIGNHSNFDYISDSNGNLQQNIIEKMTRLRNYGLYNPIMISCSGHKDSEILEEYLYENYDVKFIRARSFYKKDGTYEYMYPSGNSLIRRIISPIIMEGNRTVDEINNEIDMLVNNNVPIIMPMMHAFSSDGGSSDISEENYEKIVMHVKDLVDGGLVLCMNMMEYYQYRYPDEYANFIRSQTMSNDTRLENICVGYDDTVYNSPGDAVREQFQKHEYFLNDLADYTYTSSTTTVSHDNIYQGTIIKSDGTLQTNEYTTRFVVKKYENVSKGKYKAHGFPQNNNCLYVIVSPGGTIIEYQKIDDTLPSGTTDYDFYVLYDRCTVYVGGFDTISPMLYQYYKILSLNEEVSIPQIENNQNTLNPLYQKIVTLNGDSIANGAGCTVDGQNWGFMDFIAERNSMTLDKQAVNGGCLSVKTSEQAGRHYICNTVEDMNVNADYVLFEGGYNDYYLWHILGAITETMTNEVDNTTVYGALESICRQSLERWHTAKIGFIITHKINTTWRVVHDNSSTEHVTLEDYYQAIRDVCEKYSIPYLDLSKVSRLNTELQSYKTFTYNSDGIHPTQQGYETFYVPLIEEWMKKL